MQITANEKMTYILIIIISFCFTISSASHNVMIALIGTGILLIALVSMQKQAILLMIGLIPNIRIMKIPGIDAAVLSYCFLFTELLLLLGWKDVKVSKKNLCFVGSIIVTAFVNNNIGIFSPFLRCIVFFIFFLNYLQSEENRSYLCDNVPNIFVFGTVINIICGILYYGMRGIPIFSGRFAGISVDPNYYATVIAVAISIIVLMISYSHFRLFCGCIAAFLLVGGLLSVSRMYFFALIWPLIIVVRMMMSGKDIKKIMPVIALGIVGGLLLWNMVGPLLNNIMERFNSDSTVGGNGRVDAWEFYISNWKQSVVSILFGSGTNLELLRDNRGIVTVQHNLYVETLSEIGIIGAITMVECFYELYKECVNSRGKIIYWVPIMTAMTCYFSLNALFSETSGFILLIGFVMYENLSRKDLEINDYLNWRKNEDNTN